MAPFLRLLMQIWQQIKPPKAFSWQTLVLLSLFSWVMAWTIHTYALAFLVTTTGWVFLVLGVGWATAEQKPLDILEFKFKIGPWITATLICTRLLVMDVGVSSTLVVFPIIAALVAAMPKFIKRGPSFKLPEPGDRQVLMNTMLIHGMLSCWISFHFIVQSWVRQYPSLLADNFSDSSFVMTVGFLDGDPAERSQGSTLLLIAEEALQAELADRSWSEVEEWLWLIDEDQDGETNPEPEAEPDVIAAFKDNVLTQFAAEDDSESQYESNYNLWQLVLPDPRLPDDRTRRGYDLELRAVWRGPSSEPDGYYFRKTCLIQEPERSPTGSLGAQSANNPVVIDCGGVSDLILVPEDEDNSDDNSNAEEPANEEPAGENDIDDNGSTEDRESQDSSTNGDRTVDDLSPEDNATNGDRDTDDPSPEENSEENPGENSEENATDDTP